MTVLDELNALRDAGLAATASASDLKSLDAVRVAYLGKKGSLTSVLRGLGALSADERPTIGKVSNEVREALEGALAARHEALSGAELEARVAADAVDVTLPGRRHVPGRQHLINKVLRR
jgi:phenylalanyl-tRNA synthetase alpha chain